MKTLMLMLVAFLGFGCAAFDDASYMPSESQVKWENPHLLYCPAGSVRTCDASGGRIRRTYTNCKCASQLR